MSSPTQGSGGCSHLGFWGCGGPAGELSASLALLAAAAAGTLAAASRAPSQPRTAPGLRTCSAPDLWGGAQRSCPRPGWVYRLGLGAPGVNVQLGVCGDRIRGKWRSGQGWRRVAPESPGRRRQRGRGWTPEQAVRLEKGKTRGNRGSGRKEEREKLNEKEVGLAEGQVAFPRGQRSLVPDASRSLPDSAGRSSVKFRDGAGLGSSLNLPRPENVLSGRAAA